ncbi:MAG: glutathione-regulated potassium-efflux system protein KefC [Burkholderiaceae bacterium]|nr:glutathione-regulated potassium-efflux system protein KefC [Burkholderiaceae bacterium]
MDTSAWLQTSLIYLGAAVLAVPLAKALGLGSIIGYLAAGIVIGPWGLGLVTDPQAILQFAEFGVVLMLFLVGLELEPKRLWALRGPIFGWGSVQLLGSTTVMASVGLAFGVDWRLAVVGAFALAMSSTAIGLGVLAERNLANSVAGRSVLSVSLFQDVASIPVLALLPLLAVGAMGADGAAAGEAAGEGASWGHAARALAVVLAIVLGGRLLLRPALRWIARSRTPEIFTAASLLLVVGTAWGMQAAGLSMALGAFLAGVLLAESEYRRALETDIEPFKGLLLGLFFIAVGMGIDFGVVFDRPGLVAALVAGFVALKAVVVLAMARWMPVPPGERPVFTLLLAQGGEFGFVVLQAATQGSVIGATPAALLVAAIALSMLATPLLLAAADRWWAPRVAHRRTALPPTVETPQQAPVIIAGFGRYGQIVGRLLAANGLAATVLDHDPEQVETVRRFGWLAFYGDAARLDLLRMAGAAEARVFVLAIDDVEQSVAVATLVREHFPQLQVVARARNVAHWRRLDALGVTLVERETFESALASARSVLELMGWERHAARQSALRFRDHNVELMHRMAPHFGDEARLIAIAKEGRRQLEDMWAQERVDDADRVREARAAWSVRAADVALAPEQRDQPDAHREHHDQRDPQAGG